MSYKVAVLMGGSSFEREFSLASGRHVLRTLEAAGHEVLPLDTTSSLVEILREQQPDVAYIALHGKNGEDGTIQALLEYLNIPYVGSSANSCRLSWDKSVLPSVVKAHRATGEGPASWPQRVNLSAVAFKDLGATMALDLVPQRISTGYPLAVKPASGGSAMGITKVESFDGLAPALLEALSYDDEVLIEEWVQGVELAVCVVGTGERAAVLPPIEICPKDSYFNTKGRLNPDLVDYYVPVRPASLAGDSTVAARIQQQIEDAALEVHRSHGCRDLSRVDLIWDGTEVKVLEVNISPGMTEHSLFPMACKAANLPFEDFLAQLFESALARA
ncbi:MAG: D-alanine--D-alanine ligase [Coriobacteriales bacterium]|jgi:D-alanine-D-alanine ligase|nr:D-alanine--D-alanine ligase [Coriobacteriales bacterium]